MRPTESVTFHFDLGHLDHLENQVYQLKAHGVHHRLLRHSDETRARHAASNAALAAMPHEHLARLTHFAEEVEVVTDAVSFHWVGYPSSRPGAISDEIAVAFFHVPSQDVRDAVAAMKRDSGVSTPAMLGHYGVDSIDDEDQEDVHVAASQTINYIQTALHILMQHPEVGSLVGPTHYRTAQTIVKQVPAFQSLWQYLSTHPDTSDNPWYINTYSTDSKGNVLSPDDDLKDKDGNTVVWPTTTVDGRQVSVVPQHRLSDGLAAAALPVVQQAVKLLKQQDWLKGQSWTTQSGTTAVTRLTAAPRPETSPLAAGRGAGAPGVGAAKADWTMASRTSMYGLDLNSGSLSYDESSKTLNFKVKNWPNRGLGAYAQFLDGSGNPIHRPAGFEDRLKSWPAILKERLEPNDSKLWLQHLGAGNSFYGIPVWADEIQFSFTMPDAAASVDVLFGGLGHGDWDWDVDLFGVVYTCVTAYGIPSVLAALSVGLAGRPWYNEFFEDTENIIALCAVAFGPVSAAIAVGITELGVASTLITVAQMVAGFIFSTILKKLALKLTGYVTAQEIIDNAPFVGWALRVAGIASSIATMIATSVEVALSPATYVLEAKRSMTLNVTVKPDPTHGTSTQKPIWPKVADHFVITVQFKGGTALRKSGPMPGGDDTPIQVTYSKATGDALPSAPGQQFQILAEVYSRTNWLCGKWVSGWLDAVPTDGDGRSETGSIIEQLVPLTPTTQYTQEEKLSYDGPTGSYVWQKVVFGLNDSLEQYLNPGPVAQQVSDAFWANGVRLSSGSQVTVVADGSTWKINDPASGTGYELNKVAIEEGDKVVGYELEVANTSNPAPSGTVADLASHDVQRLVDITINDLAYKAGYCYQAKNQNLPLDYGDDRTRTASPMFVFESVSTLANPGSGMKRPGRGFLLQPFIAYDQFGPAGLFELSPAASYMPGLNKGDRVSTDISNIFSSKGFPLPEGCSVKVNTVDASWSIGVGGQRPLYDLRRQVDVVKVFNAPVPEFSPNNFYLDTRSYNVDGKYQLRLVDLHDDSVSSFDYDSGRSWGSFQTPDLSAICVHPNGYVVAISYEHDKMMILRLPAQAVDDKDAPAALPFSGTGLREGLMQGPVGMTVTSDGRILILEMTNARIQAFDTQANPVRCFASNLRFSLDTGFVEDLNHSTASAALQMALQKNLPVNNPDPQADDKRLLLTPVVSMPASFAATLNAGTVTPELKQQFSNSTLELPDNAVIHQSATNIWLIELPDIGLTYDLRLNGEGLNKVDVYRGFSVQVDVKAPSSEWIVSDRTNSLVFDVKVGQEGGANVLQFVQQISYMKLKQAQGLQFTYLDVAVESKGFIYVLSYTDAGDKTSDYRLDLYNPDGSPVTPDGATSNGQINAARMTVDQWRTVFSLNFEQMQGAEGRPEPTVSQWVPSTP